MDLDGTVYLNVVEIIGILNMTIINNAINEVGEINKLTI